MKFLITGGGTTQKIDEMRSITNQSTGRTAITLAEFFAPLGQTTILLSDRVNYQNPDLNILRFSDVNSLKELFFDVKNELYDLIIHAAAVSDYQIQEISSEGKIFNHAKIPSGLNELNVKLKPTEKLINFLRDLWPKASIVGFKLTSNSSKQEIEKNIRRVLTDAKLDYLIHNSIEERRLGKDRFNIFNRELVKERVDGIENLAKYLYDRTKTLRSTLL